MRGGLADIQNDLAILYVFGRNADTVDAGINYYMRRIAIIAHPFVHRSDQVWPFGSAWVRHFILQARNRQAWSLPFFRRSGAKVT